MPSKLPAYLFEHLPWDTNSDPIWPATTFLLRRNLAKYPFPPKLKESVAIQIEEKLRDALLEKAHLEDPQFLPSESLAALEKEFLFEQFICQESFQNTLAGQGFMVEKSSRLLTLFNIEDHLQLHLVDNTNNLEKGMRYLLQIENSLSDTLPFAYSPKFGYLTSDPTTCGTAFQITAYLHLPALIHTENLQDALAKQNEEEIETTSLQGTKENFLGDLLMIKNRFTLGVTEENILLSLHSAAMQLVVLEKALREKIKSDKPGDLVDQVSRAFGLLLHSYQLQTKETLNALSLIKLGVDLGWVSGITDQTINKAFFTCRKAHLSCLASPQIPEPKTLPHLRAEMIHKELAAMKI